MVKCRPGGSEGKRSRYSPSGSRSKLKRPLAAVVVVVVYSHLYLRAWRPTGEVPLHRVAFSAAAIALAAQAAGLVIGLVPAAERFQSAVGLAVVGLAVVVYAVVNMLLVVVVMVFPSGRRGAAGGQTVSRTLVARRWSMAA